MQIKKIHTYLVNAGKGDDEQADFSGTELIDRSGKLFLLLKSIFENAPSECEHEIIFTANASGEQQNDSKDLIVDYIKNKSLAKGKLIGLHLQSVTTKRSGQGLLFLISGEDANKRKRIVISRFPADNGIVAEEGRTLSVEFVEKIFMKNAKAYKCVYYEGVSPDSDFWEGKAIDKQINGDITISEYWIKDFLRSDFSVTPVRGTFRLANAIKKVINTTDSIEVKEELTSGVKLARSLNNKVVSARTFLRSLNLSNFVVASVLDEMNQELLDEKFKFSADELYRHVSFKSVELDNGAYLSASTESFDDVFKITTSVNDGETSYSTKGKIINERLKKIK